MFYLKVSMEESEECKQCGFSHKEFMVGVCPHCGMILYNDHNCFTEKCPSWSCPKKRDQRQFHLSGYMLLKVFKDGSEERDVFCGAPARFFLETNRKQYIEKMTPLWNLLKEEKKNRRKASTIKAAATRARNKKLREQKEEYARKMENEVEENEVEENEVEENEVEENEVEEDERNENEENEEDDYDNELRENDEIVSSADEYVREEIPNSNSSDDDSQQGEQSMEFED